MNTLINFRVEGSDTILATIPLELPVTSKSGAAIYLLGLQALLNKQASTPSK